jgi:hypothetical protein
VVAVHKDDLTGVRRCGREQRGGSREHDDPGDLPHRS